MRIQVTPAEAVYGSTYRHIIDKAQNIRNHVEEGAFDAVRLALLYRPSLLSIVQCRMKSCLQVILNGVIGWGLDSAEDINATFAALHKVMRGRRGPRVLHSASCCPASHAPRPEPA